MGWKPFKAITRAFTPPAPVRQFVANATKVTGESFQPAEILRVAGSASQTLYTGGLSALNPKIGNITLASSDPNKASVLGATIVGANSFGTVQAGNPDVKESTINEIARKIGGAISAIAVGSAAANVLTTPANALPAGVQGPVQPLTTGQQFGNFGATLISGSATAYGSGGVAQAVIGLFGKKVGSAILQIFSGDLAGAVKTLSTNPPSSNPIPPNLYGNYQSSGGGGGSGLGVGSNNGQLASNSVVLPIIGLSLVMVVVFLVMRKGK